MCNKDDWVNGCLPSPFGQNDWVNGFVGFATGVFRNRDMVSKQTRIRATYKYTIPKAHEHAKTKGG